MRLPPDSIIATEKLTRHLLVFNENSDKSIFLEKGGYSLENWQELELDIRKLLQNEASFQKEDIFGAYYTVVGSLKNGLYVKTVWLIESGTETVRFITLVPMTKTIEHEI